MEETTVERRPHLQEVDQVLADPTAAINIAVGPPMPTLEPQDPNSGLKLAGYFYDEPKRFIFKKAHLSREDFRIFDKDTGHLVCVSHHFGKNPYESLDPLDMFEEPGMFEMESRCNVTGYEGMPSFKIRPKTISMHGRQVLIDHTGNKVMSVAKISRIREMGLRHNLGVYEGDDGETAYRVECDLMGRTMSFLTASGQMAAFVRKSTKSLIKSQLIGGGSEMVIDVAPGADWTTILAIMMLIQQVGAHFLKDLFDMLVVEPMTDMVVGAGTDAAWDAGAEFFE